MYSGLKCQLSGDAPQGSWSSINDVNYYGCVLLWSKSHNRYTYTSITSASHHTEICIKCFMVHITGPYDIVVWAQSLCMQENSTASEPQGQGIHWAAQIYITYQTHMGYITFSIRNLPIAALPNGCVLLEESILVAVDSCLLSVQTVFTWLHISHKILNWLANPNRNSRLIFTSASTLSHAMQDIWLARYDMFTILLPSTESLPASRLWSASPSERVRGHISENSCGSESESAWSDSHFLSDDLNG